MATYPAPVIQELQMVQTTNYLTGMLREVHLLRIIKVNLVWARYFGSLYVIGDAAMYMCINWTTSGLWNLNRFVDMLLAINWAENIFILTMQAILVIRVYALFNQSKKVLVVLATSYILQATATFVMTGLISNKRVIGGYYTSVSPAIGSVMQLVGINPSAFPYAMNQDSTILSIVFDTILLLFALWAFVKHALGAKTLAGGWYINVLVRTLVADHLLYFICNLIWMSLSLAIINLNGSNLNVSHMLLYAGYYVFNPLVVIFGPCMVINLRTTESKTRGEGGTLEGEVSAVQFGIQEPPTQSESVT
ncbi:hypothetical protein BJ138DRAFT_1104000 [Hygrophoropsis aurantiaca]|uniref:Uncharacterized protein n=1 Tax=Hygrophoropsis aurantiaca TaxID=72124 RepID=A0ACB8A490_9AGAM|nr:hypothetical protein BJ138DRAFT_1104000 [Hygrophoropsis aurantiaca]